MSQPGAIATIRRLREAWRVQLWPLPAVGVLLGVVAGVVIPLVDAAIDDDLSPSLKVYLFGGGADAARTVLSAVSGSLITVTALTFSLTVVTLQLASSQYSPRLLRTFSSDRVVHGTLAVFLGTFTYALTVLRTVRTSADGQAAFVPQFSVTTAFLLALVSVLVLVGFLAHLTSQIRAESILNSVFTEARENVTALTDDVDPQRRPSALPVEPATAATVWASSSGFLVSIDLEDLLEAAVEADAVVVVGRMTGSSLVAGSPLATVWPRTGGAFDDDVLTRLRERTEAAAHTGFERTAAQDIGFGLRQLTDVACKSLSPGINDPTTAIHALGHSAALLCVMAGRDLGPELARDDDGQVRVVVPRPDLRELVDQAVSQPRRYGAQDPTVLGRLVALLDELAWVTPTAQLDVVSDQLARLRITAAAQSFDPTERAELAEATRGVEQTVSVRRGRSAATHRNECGSGSCASSP